MKAQISLEYATTYSWALVIMVVIIGSLIYYGALENDEVQELTCGIGPQFPCSDVYLSKDGTLGVKFRNDISDELVITRVEIEQFSSSACTSSPTNIMPGEEGAILCDLNSPVFEGDYEVIETTIHFELANVKDEAGNNVEFTVNGQISSYTEEEITTLESVCDVDRDGFWSNSPICGGIDCADNDPNWVQAECTAQADCGRFEVCINMGSCRAYCSQVAGPTCPRPPCIN